jgi:intracellular sulfur oxidation DsrE/DsrF family protein
MIKTTKTIMVLLFLTLASNIYAANDDKPFAEQKLVLQISDADPTKQTLVLNVASNAMKAYGADKIDIEIVAFGPGLRLMFADNHNKQRISGLVDNGVRFAACGNTLKKVSKILGEEPEINSQVKMVPGGIVRIIELVNQDYILVKP